MFSSKHWCLFLTVILAIIRAEDGSTIDDEEIEEENDKPVSIN